MENFTMSHDKYDVIRFYFRKPGYTRTILYGVSLEKAQEHCSHPNSSSSTCSNKVGKDRTRKLGPWFDGYRKA